MNRISTNWPNEVKPFNKLINVWSGEYGFFLSGEGEWLYYNDVDNEKQKEEMKIFLQLCERTSYD